MNRWERFWFADGARLTLGMTRIGVALSVLWTLGRLHQPDFGAALAKMPLELYEPVGILRLLGSGVPSAGFLTAIQIVAWLSTVAMLVGLSSRLSTAISLVTALALASFEVSFAPGWHHSYPLVFLAQIPLLFAPVGDAASVDRVIARLRGRKPPDRGRGAYAWGVRLVQIGVALVFFNAFVHKILQGHFSLAWALSDNLRHHLLLRFDWVGRDRTVLADWLMDGALRYKTAALLNLCAQVLPFIACFMWKRPLLRFLFGSMLVLETMGIALVMDMWNIQWIPAAMVFVDWDRLVAAVRRRLSRPAPPGDEPPEPVPRRTRRRLSVWIAAYLAVWLIVGFMYPPIDREANLFPFTRFPMFSVIRAKKPYETHQTYEVLGTRLEIDATPPISAEAQSWINRRYGYRWLHRVTDPAKLKKRLASVARDMTKHFYVEEVRSVRVWLTSFQAPAYPAGAELIEHRISISGEWRSDGTFVSYLSRVRPDDNDPARGTLSPPTAIPGDARFGYHPDDVPDAVPIALRRDSGKLHYEGVQGDAQVFVVYTKQPDGTELPFTLMRAPKFGW